MTNDEGRNMAILSGKDGTLYLGGDEVVPLSNWKLITTSSNPAYVANDTGGWKKRAVGVQDSAGSFEIKAAADQHCPLQEGDAAALKLHLDRTGDNYYDVPAIIDRIRVDVDINQGGLIAYVVEFSGNGAIMRHGIAAKPI
jgi:hypothetical protein